MDLIAVDKWNHYDDDDDDKKIKDARYGICYHTLILYQFFVVIFCWIYAEYMAYGCESYINKDIIHTF